VAGASTTRGNGIVKISQSVTVARPVEEVFRFVGDGFFEHATRWNRSTVQLKKTSPGAVGNGATGFEVRRDKDKTVERHFVFRDWERNKRFRIVSLESTSPDRFEAVYHFEPAGSGTRVQVDLEISAGGGILKFMQPIAERAARKELENEIGTLLKRAIESRAPEGAIRS